MAQPHNENRGEMRRQAGENRLVATLVAWGLATGLGGLVWLHTLDPFLGMPLTHPVTLVLFGICLAVGVGFTVYIWLLPADKLAKSDFTKNEAFDRYAAKFGWDYDNGGWYRDQAWDFYASNEHRWDLQPDGTVHHTIVIMRRHPNTVAAVHFAGREPTEIWSGPLTTRAEFDKLLVIIAEYKAAHRTEV